MLLLEAALLPLHKALIPLAGSVHVLVVAMAGASSQSDIHHGCQADAHAWVAELRTGKPLSGIAAATTHSDPYIRTRAQLAFLSPAIQHAILDGRQPPDLTLERIVRKPIPLDWDKQEKLYGFAGG